MADKDTLNLIKFKFGSFQSIKDLSSREQSSFYFADDKPVFYNAGLWYGVSSLTSSVNEETGEVTLTINGGLGEDWKDSQPVCTFVAGMTTQQKADLEKAVGFVKTFEDPNIDNTKDVIDKWNEIVAFLAGFKETDVLLDRISTLETNVTNLQNTTITGGDGLTGGGNLLKNRTIALGTPSTITDSTINEAKGTTHTHAIDEASTEQRGIVRLNDSLTSESTDQALTANQGKVLDGKVKSVADLLNDMFEKVTKNGKTYIKTKYGFASEQFVSAGGTDDTESGGSGGVNLTQMWESLQNNNDTFKDRLINVAHIPTLTTGKISDFVSATQAIADTAVANKADKDKVVDLTSNQTISGAKTFSNFKVSNTNLVTNLNAEMVGGYNSSVLFTCESGFNIDVNAPHPKKELGTLLYKISDNCGNIPPSCTNGVLVHFNHPNTDTAFQLASDYRNTGLYYRSGNLNESSSSYLYNKAWKQLAFTDQLDNYLPITGGTLTGALTVNAPINNTGALKLLGASEVSSTGMAVGSYARAVGSNSTALSLQARAGLKSTDDSNVELYGYKSLPINVDGNVVYGFELLGGETKTFTYSGAEYSVTNPDSKQLGTVFLVPIDSSFIATSVSPYNRCAVVKANGVSRGNNPLLNKVEKISDSVAILCVYNSVTKVTSNDYSGEYTIYALRKTTDTQKSGSYALAIGNNSLAIGSNSRSLQYYSVASGYQSLSAGMYSAAIGSRSIALGGMSLAIGTDSIAAGLNSVAYGNNSLALGYYTVTRRNYQTVIGYLNEEDTSNIFVIGAGSTETSRKNVFTVSPSGDVSMGNKLRIGVGGKYNLYLVSESREQLYVHTPAGTPFLIHGDAVRRGSDTPNSTLGTDQYKWFNVFTESLKIADANLTYDTGTLTVDKALKTTSTLTATQGVFSNYIKIGNATISWNPKGYLEINEGLASQKFISAGGVVTGNAGGGSGGLNLTDMWVSLIGNIDAYGKSKIHIDHIPLDVILSHDSYENDVASRINTFNYSNSSSFTSAVKALIIADNIPTLEMSKIEGLETTLTNIGTVVQNNYDNLNESISTLQKGTIADHEARIKAIEQALTWQTV